MTDTSNMTPAELREYDEARATDALDFEDDPQTIRIPVTGSTRGKAAYDVDGMCNHSRAEWFAAGLAEFRTATGSDLEDAVADMLADALHWCDRNGFEFIAELQRGVSMYEYEISPDGMTSPAETRATPRGQAYRLHPEETATILAALRLYQAKNMGDPGFRSDEIHDIATDGGAVISLDAAAIDALCESLNF